MGCYNLIIEMIKKLYMLGKQHLAEGNNGTIWAQQEEYKLESESNKDFSHGIIFMFLCISGKSLSLNAPLNHEIAAPSTIP